MTPENRVSDAAPSSLVPPLQPSGTYTPAVIQMVQGEQQFWRVSNSTSDVDGPTRITRPTRPARA